MNGFTPPPYIHKGTAFTRNFCLTLLLMFTMLSLFTVYIYHISSSAFSRQQALADESVLNQYIDTIDNTLSFINQLASTTASHADIINTAILPGLDNQQRNFSVLSTLKSLAHDNVYIDEVFLYDHSKGCLFSSNSTITALNSYHRSTMIHAALTNNADNTFRQEVYRYHSRLVRDGQKLYLVYDFIYSSNGPLGTLIILLNKDNLFSVAHAMPASSLTSYDIAVHNTDGHIIYSSVETEQLDRLSPRFSTTADSTACTYHLYGKDRSLFSFVSFGKEFSPVLIGLFFISLLLTFLITCHTYAPIKNLTELVDAADASDASVRPQPKGNEFDYLTTAYRQLITDKNTAVDLMENARPELEQKLFSSLLNGAEYTPEELKQNLAAMHSAFCVEEKYQVVLLSLQMPEQTDLLKLHVYNQAVQQMSVQVFSDSWGHLKVISPDNSGCILIIQYPPQSSIAQVKRYLRDYRLALEKQAGLSDIRFLLAAGKVYYHIADIRLSWQDAKEQLHCMLYYEEEPGAAGSTDGSPSGHYIASLIRQLHANLSKGAVTMVQSQLNQVLSEIFTEKWTLEETRNLCGQLLDIFVERELMFQAENKEDTSASYSPLYKQIRQFSSVKELRTFMDATLQSFMETLLAESQKKQNRLIARAREYIAANYHNCSLSINEIAQDVGCSPSYLSNIFTEYTHESLITYLNHYRIHMAKELLASSQILIRDVGYKTGFNTIQNFNRVFKKATGMTPNEYRKQNQNF